MVAGGRGETSSGNARRKTDPGNDRRRTGNPAGACLLRSTTVSMQEAGSFGGGGMVSHVYDVQHPRLNGSANYWIRKILQASPPQFLTTPD